jgi:hypothetical protein
VLFLQGHTLLAGLQIGIELLTMMPTQFVEEQQLWEAQLGVGITHTAAGVETSALNHVSISTAAQR